MASIVCAGVEVIIILLVGNVLSQTLTSGVYGWGHWVPMFLWRGKERGVFLFINFGEGLRGIKERRGESGS